MVTDEERKTWAKKVKMNKISYHLILINSSLRILTDQIDQLSKCIEENKIKPSFAKASKNSNPPPVTKTTQRLNYPLTTSNFSKSREFGNMNRIITGRDKSKPSIQNTVYEKIKRSRKGIAFKQILKKTGFNRKQIANAIYKS